MDTSHGADVLADSCVSHRRVDRQLPQRRHRPPAAGKKLALAQLALTGTLVGVIGSALMAWPWPHATGLVLPAEAPGFPWQAPSVKLNEGIYAWPFWGPLPSWAGEGEWQTGLATGVIGALVGTFL